VPCAVMVSADVAGRLGCAIWTVGKNRRVLRNDSIPDVYLLEEWVTHLVVLSGAGCHILGS
jgi:hypothetical protein